MKRNESSTGTKVLGTFAPEERKFQAANVPRNESSICGLVAPGNESAEERKGLESYLCR